MTCATPCVVGVNEITQSNVINSVYPNPSDNDMMIEFANSNTTHQIEIYDIAGKVIFSESTEQSVFTIKKNNTASGLYFLKVTAKNGESTIQKVIFN
jgi:hypothetical protein